MSGLRDQIAAAPDCDHHYCSHGRGGDALYVRICVLCHRPDHDDLEAQIKGLLDAKDAEYKQLSWLLAESQQAADEKRTELLEERDDWAHRAEHAEAELAAVKTARDAYATAGQTAETERDQHAATIARVRAVHHLIEWVSLSEVCGRHHWFRNVEPCAENIAVADVCPDCRPRRYMACVCGENPCPVVTALDQPKET